MTLSWGRFVISPANTQYSSGLLFQQVAASGFAASCYTWASGMLQVFGKLLYLGKLQCFRFSASCMLQVFGKLLYLGKLHASGFRQVAILGQVARFRFSASCYTWASCMLQVFGKLLYLGKLHASGFRQVAILGQAAYFRFSASCYTWASCMLQGDFGKVITLGSIATSGWLWQVITAHSSGKGAYSKVVWPSCYTCKTYSTHRMTNIETQVRG